MAQFKNSAPPKVGTPYGFPLLAGAVIGIGLFLMLPIAQWIDALSGSSTTLITNPPLPPPPPPLEIEEIDQQKVEEDKIEELVEQPPPPSLEMLEMALNADLSSMMGGDFALPTFDVATDLQNMVVELKDVDQPPRPVVRTSPVYPPDLKRDRINGQVVVQFVVDRDGTTKAPFIVSSSNPAFNESVLRAVRSWRFEPGMKSGTKVAVRVKQEIPFTVN